MKKILFITTRNPYSGRYSGDVIRAKKIIKYLRKKNSVVAVFLTKKNEIAKVVDVLFFHQIRSSQYLPSDFYGNTVLEMGDLYSDNYKQTFKNLNFFNTLKYIYLLESFLVKRVEDLIFNSFDKIILFSKSEIKKIGKKYKKKIYHISESVQTIKKIHKISPNNYKILY